jgi:hypothetical protein
MRSLPLNLAAFLTASVLVIAVSLAMFQAGVFDSDDDTNSVANPTTTPVALEASETPEPTPEPSD